MEAKFDVKMTPQIMYNFMMNHTYKSLSGFLGIAFGIASLILFGVTIEKVEQWMSILYLLFGIWFIVYLPVNLYLRSRKQVLGNETFKTALTYVIDNEGVHVLQGKQKADCKWDSILKVRDTKQSLLLYSGKRNAFVLPKESIGDQYETTLELIKRHLDADKIKLRK